MVAPVSLPRALLVGLAGGVLSGFFGVGGGIVLVPLLILAMRFDQHSAHATSLAAIFLIAVSAFLGYWTADAVDILVGIALGVGGMVGSVFGANLMHRMSPNRLRAVFAGALIVAGLRMVF